MDKLPRIPSPPGTLWREFRITGLPILVFILVLGLTIVTWRKYVGPSVLVGEAETVRATVNAPQTGQLIQLSVRSMERVSKGQVLGLVAVADPRVLQANLELSKARIHLISTSPAPELRLGNNSISYETLRLRWLQERLGLATAQADLVYNEAQFGRTQKLFADQLVSQSSLDLARKNLDSIRIKIEEQTKVVKDSEAIINAMKPSAPPPAVAGVPAAVRAALDVEQRNMELIEAQLAPRPLVSPIDGIVSTISHRQFESVPAGTPILTVSALTADRIVAYLRQPLNLELRPNLPIEIRSRSLRHETGQGRVLTVGTQLEAILPELLSAKPMSGATTEYGLPVVVSIPAGLKILPGEIVDLRPVE